MLFFEIYDDMMIVIWQKKTNFNWNFFLHSVFISTTFLKQYWNNNINTIKIIINRRFMLLSHTNDPGLLFHSVSRSSLEVMSPHKGGISTCTPRRSVLQVPAVTRGTYTVSFHSIKWLSVVHMFEACCVSSAAFR